MKVLVIEDDPSVTTLIKAALEHNGSTASLAKSASEGKQQAFEKNFDIIILDLGLPDGNGLDLLEYLREKKMNTPILILSADHETDVKVKGLSVGADDYLTKPFSTQELLARLEAITRRSRDKTELEELKCGELRVNLLDREFYVGDDQVDLTNNEFSLIIYFMKNKNRIITQEELAENVWDIHFDTQTNYINVYISYIRKKIREHTDISYIETIRKKGFELRCPEKE